MTTLAWILGSSVAMMLIALAGGFVLLRRRTVVQTLLLPLVALAAGSLIGGALFHLIPGALAQMPDADDVWLLVTLGFTTFFALEQLLHWHHGHSRPRPGGAKPIAFLILIGDGLHNLIDGLAIAGAFLVDVRLGVTAWLAAAAHEIPQEIGDLAVLVHGGWSVRRALAFNFLSGVSFLIGGVLAYSLSATVNTAFLLPFAAGNFLYIGATDLVPEINKLGDLRGNLLHLAMFTVGVGFMYLATLVE